MPRRRVVTLTDLRCIRHGAEVNAESLFEAVILGVQALKTSRWVEYIGPGTRVEVEVRSATTRHVVSVGQVQRWADGAATSPSERLKRNRLKAILREAAVALSETASRLLTGPPDA